MVVIINRKVHNANTNPSASGKSCARALAGILEKREGVLALFDGFWHPSFAKKLHAFATTFVEKTMAVDKKAMAVESGG